MVPVIHLLLTAPMYASASDVPGAAILREGLVFIPKGDFLLSGNRWIIVTDISYRHYEDLLGNLQRDFLTFSSFLANVTSELEGNQPKGTDHGTSFTKLLQYLKTKEGSHLLRETKWMMKTIKGLKEMFASNGEERPKRGLINLGGKALKWLFGTMDSDDMKRINYKVEALAKRDGATLHLMEEQTSILDSLKVHEERNERLLGKLANITNELSTAVSSFT